MNRHSSKFSATAFMFVVGINKGLPLYRCMIIHHIQPLHKSSPENSFCLSKYHIRDCDEKGESSAAEAFFVYISGFSEGSKVQCWKSVVCIESPTLYFKLKFSFPMGAYTDVCFTSPKEHQAVMNLALKLSQANMVKLQNTDHLIQTFSPPVNYRYSECFFMSQQ